MAVSFKGAHFPQEIIVWGDRKFKALCAPPRWPRRTPGGGARSGQAPLRRGEISKGILHAFPRGFYTLNGMRDTSAARTSPTSLRTTA